MTASLARLLGRPVHFPLELALANGDRYLLPHPDHADVHPTTRDLVIYPDDGPSNVIVNPGQIVSIRTKRTTS